jgi:two-component system response regulator PilR (NtrC family)
MKVRLLVVDDEPGIREMLERHFTFLGYLVKTAENGKQALKKLDEHKFDVVISDIKMPEMDGIELLRVISAEHPMVHTIMITGYVTLDNALACMHLGADTLVFKPLEDLEELERAVDKAVSAVQHWVNLLTHLQEMKPENA